MADMKISELDAVTTVDDTDEYVLARAGESKKITGANLKAAGASTVTVPVTALQMATFHTVPVELVAAPGPGFALVVIACTAFFTNGATVYDFPLSTTSLLLNYETAEESTAAQVEGAEVILNAASRGVLVLTPAAAGSTDWEGAGLEIVTTGSDPSQGDGTLLVAVTYATVEV